MAITDFFAGEIATELLRQLFTISAKAWKYKSIADRLIDMIEDIQPTIKEIQYSGVELPPHRQAQIGMLSTTLEKGKKLTEKVLSARRWNVYRQLTLARKMEKLEKDIANFLKNQILTHILADVHLLRANSDVRFDRVDRSLEKMTEHLGSMKIGGGGMIREAMKIAEATMEIEMGDDSEKFGVGLEMGKRKVKKMMFSGEGGLIGISGMGGVGKTTLARELERDGEVQCKSCSLVLSLIVLCTYVHHHQINNYLISMILSGLNLISYGFVVWKVFSRVLVIIKVEFYLKTSIFSLIFRVFQKKISKVFVLMLCLYTRYALSNIFDILSFSIFFSKVLLIRLGLFIYYIFCLIFR